MAISCTHTCSKATPGGACTLSGCSNGRAAPCHRPGAEWSCPTAQRSRWWDARARATPPPPAAARRLGPRGVRRVTVSAGVTTRLPEDGDGVEGVMRRADAALHKAKHAGRNKVVSDDSTGSLPAAWSNHSDARRANGKAER
ncbi:MAG: GGDEF domain-containing protein [Solirubrobacterales bacterium]